MLLSFCLAFAAQPFGDGYVTGEAYLKPGYLSQQPRSAAFSFGGKYRSPQQQYSGPGPASYDTISASRNSMRSAPTSSWGPPPRYIHTLPAPDGWLSCKASEKYPFYSSSIL